MSAIGGPVPEGLLSAAVVKAVRAEDLIDPTPGLCGLFGAISGPLGSQSLRLNPLLFGLALCTTALLDDDLAFPAGLLILPGLALALVGLSDLLLADQSGLQQLILE